ncbi:thymidine kinase [Pseudonocardia sp. KRD-184]|uniref:Thymidine kinase n=1 Tax=Pseudonocardia oceani TaxID=2792013 RepID=A0ABS6U8X2_9PSEU|nr:thymidine kinase [Pseudonocardia oceani]MBW0092145.1 thymidine kinase [Pseudonocardia oceani]MBW0098023.1 thymidine kinase [Pseudonocardia oceani]MBW0111626.1 thymidine kinase [Pseudonocardia oceani]MBW0124013.1 thymidine kinase [Pseudonocardia oceani]MBW0128695.1 thymidine kinase [Pseudonocardia oceani]
MAKLYFRYGAMNSGKSTALIQVAHNYEERGQRVLIVKPATDTKSPAVLSRIGVDRDVDLVAGPEVPVRERILAGRVPPVDCVLVDEAQFLAPAQVDDLFRLAVEDGVPVIAYGLRSDFRTRGFPGSIRLMELAHSIEELKTICRCGRKAILNARTVDGGFTQSGDQVAIEGDVGYESMCGSCYLREFDWPPR